MFWKDTLFDTTIKSLLQGHQDEHHLGFEANAKSSVPPEAAHMQDLGQDSGMAVHSCTTLAEENAQGGSDAMFASHAEGFDATSSALETVPSVRPWMSSLL